MSDRELPPRGELFAAPELTPVWAAISNLPETGKHQLLARLQQHLACPDERATPTQVQAAKAIAAVREAQRVQIALSGSEELSSYQYTKLQEERPDHDWPPIASVRRWLGVRTWAEVLAACHLPAPRVGDGLEPNWNQAFSQEEAIDAVLECHRDLGEVPSWSRYRHWACRTDVKRRPGRRPRGQLVFDRLWRGEGGFKGCLAAAGLIEGAESAVPQVNGRQRLAGYRYPASAMRSSLCSCEKAIGRTPNTTDYHQWREEELERRRTVGGPALPHVSAFFVRYGTWAAALADAGLVVVEDAPAPRGRGRKPIDMGVMRTALEEAYQEVGEPFTMKAYNSYRDRVQVTSTGERLPSPLTIAQRFGGWPAACKQLLGGDGGRG